MQAQYQPDVYTKHKQYYPASNRVVDWNV